MLRYSQRVGKPKMDEYRNFSVKVMSVNGLSVVALFGEWDLSSRDDLHDALSLTGTLRDVVVDARAANFFDSTALSEFVAFFKRVTDRGRRFELLIGNSNIGRLLELTGLRDVLLPSAERRAFLEKQVPSLPSAANADNAALKPS